MSGFGARRQKGDSVAYVVKYRTTEGRQRWATIGRHGSPWTPDLARAEALRLLAEVARGGDPARAKKEARTAATVSELCDIYLEACEAGRLLTRRQTTKKPSTLVGDKARIERHIRPLLGSLKIAAVTRADIERFRDGVSEGATKALVKTGKHGLARVTGGRGTATRAMGMLGAMFSFRGAPGIKSRQSGPWSRPARICPTPTTAIRRRVCSLRGSSSVNAQDNMAGRCGSGEILGAHAADLGYSELTIAALLGHRKASMTSRYAYHADAVLLQAADAVSDRIAELMGKLKASSVGAVGPQNRDADPANAGARKGQQDDRQKALSASPLATFATPQGAHGSKITDALEPARWTLAHASMDHIPNAAGGGTNALHQRCFRRHE